MDVILYFNPLRQSSNPEKIAGVLEIAKKAQVHVQIVNELPTKDRIRSLCAFWQAKGIIVECSGCKTAIDTKTFKDIPVVLFNHDFDTLSPQDFAICHDSKNSGELAARELMMSGCENFTYIPAPENAFWSREREQRFRSAIELNGKHYTPFSWNRPANSETRRNKILRSFLKQLVKPCAIFAANDSMAAEVLTATRMAKLAIPNEIAILGVDNSLNLCEHTTPTLSSIEPDFRRGGNIAMLMLLAIIRNPKSFRGPHQRTFGDAGVVRRLSTKRLLRPDPRIEEALDYIRQRACEGLKAADVIRRFPCSRRMADLRFRRAVGHSILDEIHSIQLDRAKSLLMNAHQELKSISDFCGFRHPNSMRKFFHKQTGLTLSAWRKKHLSPVSLTKRQPRTD